MAIFTLESIGHCGFVKDDGGREAYFKGTTGDCFVRAVAIATKRPYNDVYGLVNHYAKQEKTGKRKKGKSDARTGVYSYTADKVLLEHYGWRWKSCMQIGSGCQVHLRADELPSGRIICRLSKHYVAVIDGVIHDLSDCSRDGTRCVYGYYYFPSEQDG